LTVRGAMQNGCVAGTNGAGGDVVSTRSLCKAAIGELRAGVMGWDEAEFEVRY